MQAVRTGLNAKAQGDTGRVMVVLLTDGRANVSLAKSNEDPEALAEGAPKATKVGFACICNSCSVHGQRVCPPCIICPSLASSSAFPLALGLSFPCQLTALLSHLVLPCPLPSP